MKHLIIPFLLLVCICGCTLKQTNKAGQSTEARLQDIAHSTNAPEDGMLPDSLFFMLQDSVLPRRIDLNQDISRLSYSQLRLLRAYVYATHGHWLMEADLNRFFSLHTDWYFHLCDSLFDSYAKDTTLFWAHENGHSLVEDYPKAFSMIKLTEEEQGFVDRITRRMDEKASLRYTTSAQGDKLLNPELAVNAFQIATSDTNFAHRLHEHNMVLQPARYLQLFNIYEANEYHDIPSFVTTDVMLQAFHMYFTYVLKRLELHEMKDAVRDALWLMLRECNTRLKDCPEERVPYELDNAVYCLVGLKLMGHEVLQEKQNELEGLKKRLEGKPLQTYEAEVKLVMQAADGMSPLFHTKGEFPYSLFKPRGHYTRDADTERYFRTMMWLQRGCFRRVEPTQLSQAINMAQLINSVPGAKELLGRINRILIFLVGTPDNVSLLDLATFMREEKLTDNDVCINQEAIAKIDTWLKEQFRTCNRIHPKEQTEHPDELNLLPGRYTLDGEILSELYDPERNAKRAYPSGLDVMDVLGGEEAGRLVRERNQKEPWDDDKKLREEQRERIKKFNGWNNSIYNKWLHTLVQLQKTDKQQPLFMQTQAWRLKSLNTALASWAMLKHDTSLYIEQPIAAECGGGGLPDPLLPGYVEPNLPFWKEMEEQLALCRKVLERNGFMTDIIEERARSLEGLVGLCRRATEKELAGEELDYLDYEDIRHIGSRLEWFTLSVIDPDISYGFWDEIKGADRFIAKVTDVFTRNITGCPRDGILYAATGMPVDLYVLVEMQGRYYITRGAVYSYHEFVRPLGDRMTDEQWQDMLLQGKVPDVPEWFAPMLLRDEAVLDERFIYCTGC